MEHILGQKLDLGLIKRKRELREKLPSLKLSRDINKTEMILCLIDYNPNSIWKKNLIKKCNKLKFSDQIRIMHGGLAMWELSLTPLPRNSS